MVFRAEQECPQCGAPLELAEADQLLDCPFCNTRNFLVTPDHHRYLLPHPEGDGQLIHVPYLHFRGSVFSCQPNGVQHRVADISQLASPLIGLPPSLGLRPQAMKLRFATPDSPGTFLKNLLTTEQALARVSTYSAAPSYHQAHIGEVLSLIYLPLRLKDEVLHDAITSTPLARLPEDQDILGPLTDTAKGWRITTLATLCPQCGWNLEGDRSSIALTCANCDTVWEAGNAGFSLVPHVTCAAQTERPAIYLPFWRITASSVGLAVNSLADFIRITNQPRLPRPEWEKRPMAFWSPAFKIRPKIYLQLASQLTTAQTRLMPDNQPPVSRQLYPVTLAKKEAVQSLKVILVNTATNKKELMPALPATRFAITDITLVYVPFTDQGYNLYQEKARANINKQTLAWGSRL